MDRCSEIKADMMMEERYEGLCLHFGDNIKLKEEVFAAIESTSLEMNRSPLVYENVNSKNPQMQSVYVEFHDDIHREGGEFFNKILKKLRIDKCERGV